MAGMDLPVRAIREQVASAVDLIVHQARLKDGTRRITHVTEVERMEGDVITLQDIFLFDNSAGFDSEGRSLGSLKATGPAAEVPGEDAAQQRHRRPDALRHDGLPMTGRLHRCAAPLVGACCLVARSASLRPRSRPRTGARPRTPTIDHAQPTKGAVRLLVSVPGDAEVDHDSVEVTIDGTESTPRPSPPRRAARSSAPRSWRSTPATAWRASRIAEAKKAALAYLDTVPANVKVGVSPSTTTVKTLVPPTLDRDAATRARSTGSR